MTSKCAVSGGDALAAEGAQLLARVEDLSVLGFGEVLRRLPFFRALLDRAGREIETWRPDVVIPVDYPGFNLRLARRARERGHRVAYYIAPQVWAWRRERRPGIARAVDRLLVVFPFEEPLFREAGIDAVFVGHPLLDASDALPPVDDVRRRVGAAPEAPLLALLPGSRVQEVRAILPRLLAGARVLRDEGAIVAVSRAPGLPDRLFARAQAAGFPIYGDAAAGLARAADAALVASGTATLETGLLGTPLAVVYRTSAFNWTLARALVKVRTVGLGQHRGGWAARARTPPGRSQRRARRRDGSPASLRYGGAQGARGLPRHVARAPRRGRRRRARGGGGRVPARVGAEPMTPAWLAASAPAPLPAGGRRRAGGGHPGWKLSAGAPETASRRTRDVGAS